MCRYRVDKFWGYTDGDASRIREYAADPERYVTEWERRGRGPQPVPDGGVLDPDERGAFVGRDYGQLYRMGAHPYLLLHFARAIEVHVGNTPWPEFLARYRAQVAPHGFPDFTT